MVIYNNKKVLFFRRISFSGWIDYTNNWFDGAKYFNCNDIYNLFDNNIDIKKYISEKINAGYLNRELSILGVESINELYPKGLI